MDVAKDLPSSNLKTVISEEWNLHRPDRHDLDDLMFWSVVVLFVSKPGKLWQDGHSSSTLFGGTYCGKESCKEGREESNSCKASQKGCKEGCKEEVVF